MKSLEKPENTPHSHRSTFPASHKLGFDSRAINSRNLQWSHCINSKQNSELVSGVFKTTQTSTNRVGSLAYSILPANICYIFSINLAALKLRRFIFSAGICNFPISGSFWLLRPSPPLRTSTSIARNVELRKSNCNLHILTLLPQLLSGGFIEHQTYTRRLSASRSENETLNCFFFSRISKVSICFSRQMGNSIAFNCSRVWRGRVWERKWDCETWEGWTMIFGLW